MNMKTENFNLYTIYTDEEYIAALRYFGFKEEKAKENVRKRKSNGTLCGINDLVRNYRMKGNKMNT